MLRVFFGSNFLADKFHNFSSSYVRLVFVRSRVDLNLEPK